MSSRLSEVTEVTTNSVAAEADSGYVAALCGTSLAHAMWMSPVRNTVLRMAFARRCASSSRRSSVYPSHWSVLRRGPPWAVRAGSANGLSNSAGIEPTANGEIITELPISRQVVSEEVSPP